MKEFELLEKFLIVMAIWVMVLLTFITIKGFERKKYRQQINELQNKIEQQYELIDSLQQSF